VSPLPAAAPVVIIGGGIAGLSVAAALGGPALILEQRTQAGLGATAENAGMVRRLGEDPYERALALRTHDRLCALEATGQTGASWRTGALLGLCHEPEHLHDGVAHLRAAGVVVEHRRGAALAEVAPLLRGSPLAEGWWLPDERVASASALIDLQLAAARAAGADLRTGQSVRALDVAAGRVAGVWIDAPAGPRRVAADAVVLAAGAWCAGLAAAAGLARHLIPVRRTLLLSAGGPPPPAGHPWVWIDDLGLYARPEGEGWLLSGCDERVDWPAGAESAGEAALWAQALTADKARAWLPGLGAPSWRTGWSGLRTFAPDRRPMLGPDPALPGLHWCAGLGGFGVSCGLAAGEAVAAWLRGDSVPWLDPAGVRPDRRTPGRWPLRPTGELWTARLSDGRALPPAPA
jgi:D-arginine dehydrogenase